MKKFLFDLFPLILFFIAFKFYDIFTATAVAMVAAVAQLMWLKLTGKAIEATHWINLTVIVVFGGATLLLKNDAFIKWKPTVLYWLFALILVGGRLFFKRNLMQKIMGDKVSMAPAVWDKMNYSWSAFFVVSGALNLYVAFSGHFTESQWVNFKVFGLMALLVVFVIGQSIWLGRHMNDSSDSTDALTAPTEPKEGR
jgi:intracellular septation protein